ncbi:hypothetical protein PUR61_05475 [Streptomyces sp. BE20]|uniref:hypothetical protein n=1 Tax=Streptomyces sp. BE20 TaxID=3002525 RepID=UPI000A7BBEF9|nr:hypothetical protein [Streptomyces sp. BE20]MEE1821646.1 hypothetical protein [Streptomyces sp. BE20]
MPDTTTLDMPFTFSVPKEFEAIDFTRSPEERADATLANLRAMDPKPSEEEMLQAVVSQQTVIDLLADSGAVYAGVLVAKDDNISTAEATEIVSALLTVTIKPSDLKDTVTVNWLTDTLTTLYPGAEIGIVVLPTGPDRAPAPAVLVTEEVELPQPVNLIEDTADKPAPSRVRQLHVFVPITGRTAMADFSISTQSLENWDACVTILASICETITFN